MKPKKLLQTFEQMLKNTTSDGTISKSAAEKMYGKIIAGEIKGTPVEQYQTLIEWFSQTDRYSDDDVKVSSVIRDFGINEIKTNKNTENLIEFAKENLSLTDIKRLGKGDISQIKDKMNSILDRKYEQTLAKEEKKVEYYGNRLFETSADWTFRSPHKLLDIEEYKNLKLNEKMDLFKTTKDIVGKINIKSTEYYSRADIDLDSPQIQEMVDKGEYYKSQEKYYSDIYKTDLSIEQTNLLNALKVDFKVSNKQLEKMIKEFFPNSGLANQFDAFQRVKELRQETNAKKKAEIALKKANKSLLNQKHTSWKQASTVKRVANKSSVGGFGGVQKPKTFKKKKKKVIRVIKSNNNDKK